MIFRRIGRAAASLSGVSAGEHNGSIEIGGARLVRDERLENLER